MYKQKNSHCWDTRIFKSQEGQVTSWRLLGKVLYQSETYFQLDGDSFTFWLYGYEICCMYNLLCFVKTEVQIPWQQKIQSFKWNNMKDAYYEIFLMQIMLLRSFCRSKNFESNVNILLDLSKFSDAIKCVSFRLYRD